VADQAENLTCNVVYAATMANTLYAFDADMNQPTLWSVNFGAAVGPHYQGDLALYGIMSTPYIDVSTFRMYLVTHRYVAGQLQRTKRPASIRGLNENHNHELKNLFKGAAIIASSKPGPFQQFYAALLAKGIRPEMARLTLARKIAAITLTIWKKGASFDARYLKPQTA
jgi:hypothetical protein